MKILVISPEPFFTPRGTPFSVYYRTLITTQLGAKVDVLTYGEGADVDIPGARIYRIPRFAALGHVKVGPSLLKLFLDFFLILYTVKMLLQHEYDVVHAHEEAIFYCRFLKPVFKFKLIYDMHSSLPQQLTNFEFTSSKFLIGLFKKLEDSCLRKADAVITICPDLSDYVNGQIENREKHFLIENSIFDPVKLADSGTVQQEVSDDQQDDSPFPAEAPCVVYAGTLEAYQGIDILIRAFALFNMDKPEYRLVIVGGTPEQVNSFSALAAECGIAEKSVFTGQVRQPLAKAYCARASILVSPRSSGTNTPLKVYEQLESGLPLVATRIYSHTQVLDDAVAFLVEPTPEDMARGLLAATGPQAVEKAANAHRLYEERYSRVRYIEKMKNLFAYLGQQSA
jgi:glycosyltransferase involved in cell wall biosynthesis